MGVQAEALDGMDHRSGDSQRIPANDWCGQPLQRDRVAEVIVRWLPRHRCMQRLVVGLCAAILLSQSGGAQITREQAVRFLATHQAILPYCRSRADEIFVLTATDSQLSELVFANRDLSAAATFEAGNRKKPQLLATIGKVIEPDAHVSESVACAAIDGLRANGSEPAWRLMAHGLNNRYGAVRIKAAENLGARGAPAAIPALIEGARNQDASAIHLLGRLRARAAIPALKNVYRAWKETDQDRRLGRSWQRQECIFALARIRDRLGLSVTRRWLVAGDWQTREASAAALGDAGDRNAVPLLTHALRDPNMDVRLRAVEALGELGATKAVAEIERMAAEPSPDRTQGPSGEVAGRAYAGYVASCLRARSKPESVTRFNQGRRRGPVAGLAGLSSNGRRQGGPGLGVAHD